MQGFAAEFQRESDRATAVLAAALLDERLRQLLAAYLIDDEKEVSLLLEPEQPLGSFGARVRTAYCLGLLDKDLYRVLLNVKKVRNSFAHELHGLTFDDPAVAAPCAQLRASLKLPKGFEDLAPTPRSAFISATFSAHSGLWVKAISYEVNGKRCKVPEWKTLVNWSADPDESPTKPAQK